jgi:hypothetical protein
MDFRLDSTSNCYIWWFLGSNAEAEIYWSHIHGCCGVSSRSLVPWYGMACSAAVESTAVAVLWPIFIIQCLSHLCWVLLVCQRHYQLTVHVDAFWCQQRVFHSSSMVATHCSDNNGDHLVPGHILNDCQNNHNLLAVIVLPQKSLSIIQSP